MNLKSILLGISLLILLSQSVFAQRPIIQPGQQFPARIPQGERQQRQPVNPDEETDELSRRTLLDDSTRQVYGPKTSLIFFEKDLKRNRLQLFEQDTSLTNFHNYDVVAKSGWKYQDLGNIGSAAKPVFYEAPDLIGTSSGLHAYDIYFKDPAKRRFFDTKSPFTEMSAFFGGGNRNLLDIAFARNVNPRWNVGFEYNTYRVRKTLNPINRDDHMANQNALAFHTNYRSENGRYWILAAFSRMMHRVDEIGGIIPPEVDSTSIYFTYEDAKVWLQNSNARDLRQDYHIYHEYKLGNGLQLYHVFDRKNQNVAFFSNLNSADSLFYPKARLINPDTLAMRQDFAEWRNELGVKGSYKGFYYNAFARFRNARMINSVVATRSNFNEVYIGGELIGKISEKWSVSADGEYLIPGNYRIHGLFVSPWIDLEYTKSLYKPTAIQQQFSGNLFEWNTDFSDTGMDQIKGTAKIDLGEIRLRPSLTFNRVNNYVYFDTDFLPKQTSSSVVMLMPSLRAQVPVGRKFKWDTEVIFTSLTGAERDAFRIPQVFGNTRFYFDGPVFEGNAFVQLGIDVRYRSSYFAEAYMPAYQQFYLQNRFEVYAYPVADLFLDVRINRTRVLFKYNHLNAGLLNREGYFVTPDYTGYRSFLDLGITWYLFD